MPSPRRARLAIITRRLSLVAARASALGTLALAAMLCLSPRSALAQPDADVQVAESSTGAAIDPGVDDIGLHCDDCVAQIEFPFPVWFYGKTHARAYVSSNGTLQFTAQPSNEYADTCLPTRVFDNTLFVLWDDLRLNEPGDGIFTSITGEAPNRVFNIEWRAHYYLQPGTANFEVRFFENSRNFEVIYGTYTNNTYTIGAQKGRGERSRDVRCNFATPYAPGTRFVFSDTSTGSYGSFAGYRSFPTGVDDLGMQCDDCVASVTPPFPIRFYRQDYASMTVSSNGNIQFLTADGAYSNVCPPVPSMGPAIFAHWDDLRTDTSPGHGVFTRTSGVAPGRTFDVEWRAVLWSTLQPIHFSVRFFEGLDYYETYYDTVPNGAAFATIGAQAGDERYSLEWCNGTPNVLAPNSLVTNSFSPVTVTSFGSSVLTGDTDINARCDDCVTTIALPFPVSLYGRTYSSANVSSNGTVQFESTNPDWINAPLPRPSDEFGPTIFAHWDDLRTDLGNGGIYTRVLGTFPNRLFVIHWQAVYFYDSNRQANFALVLYEETPRFDVYLFGLQDQGASATVGVQNADGTRFAQYSSDALGRMPANVAFTGLGANCPADLDDGTGTGVPDNGVDINDLLYFLTQFELGDISADLDDDGQDPTQPDGGVDINDLLFFLAHFEAGC